MPIAGMLLAHRARNHLLHAPGPWCRLQLGVSVPLLLLQEASGKAVVELAAGRPGGNPQT